MDKKCSIEFDVCLYLIGDKMYYESRKPISEFKIKHNECIEELNGGEIESREFNISNRKGIDSDGSYGTPDRYSGLLNALEPADFSYSTVALKFEYLLYNFPDFSRML